MTVRILRALLACAILTACSGGGGGSNGAGSSGGSAAVSNGSSSGGQSSNTGNASTPGNNIVALDPNNPGNYAIHYVIEDGSGRRGLDIVPVGSTEDPTLQPAPAPGAVITYPDGSVQTTDGNGIFNPASSQYVTTNATALQTNPNAAPFVLILDPTGKAIPLYTQFDTSGNPHALSGTGTTRATAGATTLSLSSVTAHPSNANAFVGTLVPFEVVGIDSAGNINKLSTATVSWTAGAGTILPVPNTARILYRAPASGTGYDVVRATVTMPGNPVAYTASATVAYVDAAGSYAVNGVVNSTGASTTPLAAAFLQNQNASSILGSYYWFAPINPSTGAFSINLPKNVTFTPLLQSGLNGTLSTFVALLGPGNSTTFGTQAQPTSTVAFTIPAAPPTFVLPTPAPAPPVASIVSDAWNASGLALVRHLFDADSGLNDSPKGILVNELPMSSPATVADGLFAGWQYQWTYPSGTPVLTLVEANGKMPGTHSATIVPTPTGYSYVRYVSAAPLSLAAPLVAQQSTSMLDSSGTWTQAGTSTSPFTANVTMQIYGASRQTLGFPQYTETLLYSRDSVGDVALSPDSLYDSNGRAMWSLNATRTVSNAMNYGTSLGIYSYAGSLTRYYYLATGQQSTSTFTLSGTANGDGSGHASYAAQPSGLAVVYDLVPSSAASTLLAQNGIVSSPGTLPPQLATFTVSAGGVVNATVFADPTTGFPGNPLSFSL